MKKAIVVITTILILTVTVFAGMVPRDFSRAITWNFQIIPAGTMVTCNFNQVAGFRWDIENVSANSVWIGFGTQVTAGFGFELKKRTATSPGGWIGDNGNHNVFLYSASGTTITWLKRINP